MLCFLGIELDSVHLTARLPDDKLAQLVRLVNEWGDRKMCTKQQLLSLIGVLQHASSVVRFGRCFLRRMIDLSTTAAEPQHHIRLNREFRLGLQWWVCFAPHWNGTCLLALLEQATLDIVVHSNASGSWGFGAVATSTWFHGSWPSHWGSVNITAKELLPIVLAASIWGKEWAGKAIEFRCDNEAIVGAISSWRSREPLVMHLLRGLALLAMQFSFHLKAVHIPGISNVAADALSWNNLPPSSLRCQRLHQLPIPFHQL